MTYIVITFVILLALIVLISYIFILEYTRLKLRLDNLEEIVKSVSRDIDGIAKNDLANARNAIFELNRKIENNHINTQDLHSV